MVFMERRERLPPRVRVDVERMNQDHKLSLNGKLVFSLLALLIIWVGQLTELLDSRKNRMNIWEAPSLVEDIHETNYYKSVLEKGKKMITCSEIKKKQVNWDNQLKNNSYPRAAYLKNFYKKAVTISNNEMICRKSFSFNIITSFGLKVRNYRTKESVKHEKINLGQTGQKKRKVWEPGLAEKNTINKPKEYGEHKSEVQWCKWWLKEREQRLRTKYDTMWIRRGDLAHLFTPVSACVEGGGANL